MAVWKYRARVPGEKKAVTKSIEAATYADVYNSIVKNGWIPEKITKLDKEREEKKAIVLTLREVTIFCRQFSTMIGTGITISKAFDILQTQEKENKNEKRYKLYHNVYEEIQRGQSLYEALKLQGSAFPAMLTNMVQAGEMSGNLDTIMERTAVYFEKQSRMMSKLRSSLAYPKILMIMALTIVIALFTFVLPNFFVVFEQMEVELPYITQVVVKISDFLREKWYIIIFVVIGTVLAWKIALTSPPIAYEWDYIKTRIPIVKEAMKKTAISNFTSTMGMMYSSGVSMLDSITVAATVLQNRYYESEFRYIIDSVAAGAMMSTALLESKIFEPMVSSMLFIGEESGNLDELLDKTADFYETEADEAISKMVTTIEPIILVVIGIIVLVLIASVILPSFALATGLADKY
jgi:type IV pilus assembly protein PilC